MHRKDVKQNNPIGRVYSKFRLPNPRSSIIVTRCFLSVSFVKIYGEYLSYCSLLSSTIDLFLSCVHVSFICSCELLIITTMLRRKALPNGVLIGSLSLPTLGVVNGKSNISEIKMYNIRCPCVFVAIRLLLSFALLSLNLICCFYFGFRAAAISLHKRKHADGTLKELERTSIIGRMKRSCYWISSILSYMIKFTTAQAVSKWSTYIYQFLLPKTRFCCLFW